MKPGDKMGIGSLAQVNSQLASIDTNLDSFDAVEIDVAWQVGYINGSTGAEGGSAPNTNLRTPMLYLQSGTKIKNTHTGRLIIYEYTSVGVFIGRIGSVKSNATFEVLSNKYVRCSFEYGTSTSDTSIPDLYITIKTINKYDVLSYALFNSDLNGDTLTNLSNRVENFKGTILPKWELGYINGSTGAKTSSEIVAVTANLLFLPQGSTLTRLDASATFTIMLYNSDGTWIKSLGTSGSLFTAEFPMIVKLNYNYNGNPVITDLELPNTKIAIVRGGLAQLTPSAKMQGKRIAYFGTSIPNGTAWINGAAQSYPSLLGAMLGATVYNESLGSSAVRAGNYNYIAGGDTMGYAGVYWPCLAKSLSLSSSEKQTIFDNWATWQPIIPDAPVTVPSAGDQTLYKNSSWDILLAKYLTGGSVGQVDYYVFDHGINDAGYLYDYDDLDTMPVALTDRTYFLGAMNFIVDKILSDNPLAKIVFVGHYENDRKAGISIAQKALAEYWGFPLIPLWEKLGWTQKSVTSGGTTKTMTQWAMVDDLHPHTDTTGKAILKIANTLYPYFRDLA